METPDKNDATVLLRLPNELKALPQREAAVNGRRITAEINMRLKASLETTGMTPPVRGALPRKHAALKTSGRVVEAGTLDDTQRALLTLIARMAPEKQLSLLTLLK